MSNPHQLTPTLQAIRDSMIRYQDEELYRFQDLMNREKREKHMDGKHDVIRLLNAQRKARVPHDAPHELAWSDRKAEELGRAPQPGFAYVPYGESFQYVPYGRRDLNAGNVAAGGYLVSTDTAPGDTFVGALLAALPQVRMGMPVLSLRNNASFPKITATITVGWLANETALLTESDVAFAVAAGSPKTVGAYCEISDQLLMQTSPAAQTFLFGELGRAVASNVDSKIVNGTGASGQPLGILATTGIGSTSGTALGWSGALDVISKVEDANALVDPRRTGWIMPPLVAKLLRGRERAAGSGFMVDDNRMAGYPVGATNSVPADSLLFGDWSGAALLDYGALQIAADPYGANSELFKKKLVGLRALWSCDVVVLRAASFSKSESIT